MQDSRFLKIVIAILLIINVATLSFMISRDREGRPPFPHGPGGPDHGGPFEFIVHELNMDETQRSKFAELRDEHHQAVEELQEASHELHDKYFEELANPAADSVQINAMADSMAGIQKQIDLVTWKHFSQVRAICKPEQQKKFDVIIREALRMMQRPRP